MYVKLLFYFRVNYIVSLCGLHKITYLGTNSLKSNSRVLTFHFATFGGINVIFRFQIRFCSNQILLVPKYVILCKPQELTMLIPIPPNVTK
ncbi:hypothetical protein Hanom_Chr13g01222151 [Helianthus anomalus]